MTQIDSIRVDVPSTLERIRAIYSRRKERVAREAAYLEEQGIGLVVVDIPALPIEAAALHAEFRGWRSATSRGTGSIRNSSLRIPAGETIVDILHEEYAQNGPASQTPVLRKDAGIPSY